MPIAKRVRDAIASSLRYKLLVLVLFPLLIVMPTLLGLAVYWSQRFTYDQLYAKVKTDLSVAHDVFARLQRDYLDELKALGESYSFRVALQANDAARLDDQITLLRRTTDFDFLHLVGPDRRRTWTGAGGDSETSTPSPLLEEALRFGKPGVGVQIYFEDALANDAPELEKRIALPLIDTQYAAPTTRRTENRAMVIRAIYPVKGIDGRVVAVLDGGVLLNNNFPFVDTIRDLVYGPGSVPDDGWGTVTVFLDDVRISTNVPLAKGERALGTRVSREVRDQVLGRGDVWVNRAFVVNDWYISAYEPIIDVYGERAGMLYAGFLESPYTNAYLRAITFLVVGILIAAAFAGLLVFRGAKSVFKPIEAMTQVVRATQAGEERRIREIDSQDEIGELARQFDSMLELLRERSRQIHQAADELEIKVDERTRELTEKNVRLQKTINLLRQTRQQLATAEKLAALGELTAGVAHEINNPTAVILGNMDVLVRELGGGIEPVKTEIDLIIEQVYRIRAIVEKLLQYARPTQYAGYLEEVDVNTVVEDTLALVKHELATNNAAVRTDFRARNRARINRQELQQVVVNLLVNAAHSIPNGGRIELTTRDEADIGVEVIVKDYGIGIPLEDLGRVFDPFFTRKERGTGLGLSVSYGLIRRYGGQITVESEEGAWTRFTIQLLKEPVFGQDEEALMERYAARG